MIREILAVSAGGAIGSAARYAVSCVLLAGRSFCGFPVGTFAVNVAGSFLIGLLLETLDDRMALWLLAVGFCGGFTTFSSFSADTVRMLRAGCYAPAALCVLLSVGICIAGTALGIRTGTLLKNG